MLGFPSATTVASAPKNVSRSVVILAALDWYSVLQICFASTLRPADMVSFSAQFNPQANLVEKEDGVFILTLHDIRLCPEFYARLDNSTVNYRIPGHLIHGTAFMQCDYVIDLHLLDSLLVSTSRSDIKTDLIETLTQCGTVRFVQKFSHKLLLIQV
jgi:hypothetical protein